MSDGDQHACEHCGCHAPKPDSYPTPDYRRIFALQQQARNMGRHILTGGQGWRGSYYGAVAATSPGPGQAYRRDSWRCHHQHPDDLTALECALGEVRRLGAGGPCAPCSAGPGCQGEWCRRDWARLSQSRRS